MDFKDLVARRRSIRTFTEREVTAEEEKMLLRAALLAPSSKGKHGYAFKVVRDRELMKKLSETKSIGSAFLAEAPMAIVVLGEPEVSDIWIEDGSCAAAFMLLQAEDMGLGGCWVQVRERGLEDGTRAEDLVREALQIPEQYKILCMVAVGEKAVERKPQNEDKIAWERVL